MALCMLCHFAFDNNEWGFLPNEASAWNEAIAANPAKIFEYNQLTSVLYRRIMYQPDRESLAFRNAHCRAAFRDVPVKVWTGEASITVMGNHFPGAVTPQIGRLAFQSFKRLIDTWEDFVGECPLVDCHLCQSHEQERIDDDDDDNDDDDEEEDKDGDRDGNEGEEGKGKGKETEETEEEEADEYDEDEEGNEEASGCVQKKNKELLRGRPITPKSTNQDMRAMIRTVKDKDKAWQESAPYDTRVPFSHRKGVSHIYDTANDRIASFLASREVNRKENRE